MDASSTLIIIGRAVLPREASVETRPEVWFRVERV